MSDLALYRDGLALMLQDRHAFFRSDLFGPFYELLERRFAGNANSLCRQWGYPAYALEETASLVLTCLLEQPPLVHRLLTDPEIDCPFSYVGGTLRKWVGLDTGHLPKERPADGPRTMYRTSIDAPSFVDRDIRDPFEDADQRLDQVRERIDSGGAHTLAEAIQLTTDALTPRTPTRLRPHLQSAVFWMAYNPIARTGHENVVLEDAYKDLAALEPTHVRAIANVTWGVRDAQAETSLLGAYVLDRAFDYRRSDTHRAGLAVYRSTMHQPRRLMAF
ncbi:hypothetical protein ACI2IX_20150 [Leifsonia aquatica]|uniref:hypothetical protein n=1 Tax=Leifsonia aquatica TaxID=144185 RepID=UPI00384F4D4D